MLIQSKDIKQQLSITHSLENMTYYENGTTLGAYLAFQGIENWRLYNHKVTFTASIMKDISKDLPPSHTKWAIDAKVKEFHYKRPVTKIKLFEFLTEAEALSYLRVFQEEPLRSYNFNRVHTQKYDRAPLDPTPRLKTRLNPYSINDTYNKITVSNLQRERARRSKSLLEPGITMTEKIYNFKNLEEAEIDEQGHTIIYAESNENYDTNSLTKNLDQMETVELVKNVEDVSCPMQFVSIAYRSGAEISDYSFYIPESKEIYVQDSINFRDIYALHLVGANAVMKKIFMTTEEDKANQIMENCDLTFIQPNIEHVSAHQEICTSYSNHYKQNKRSLGLNNAFISDLRLS